MRNSPTSPPVRRKARSSGGCPCWSHTLVLLTFLKLVHNSVDAFSFKLVTNPSRKRTPSHVVATRQYPSRSQPGFRGKRGNTGGLGVLCIPAKENDGDDGTSGFVETGKQSPQRELSTPSSNVSSDPTLWSKRGPLFRLTRPTSIPGIIFFHMLGIYLVLSSTGQATKYWTILLREPTMWLTLISLFLVSSTSMVVNDYYDAKLGRDALKEKHKILVEGVVSMRLAKRFASYLYGAALVCVSFLPGAPTRLLVNGGLMLTYFYTVHLKPMTLVKNMVCAGLVGLSPLTSGSAAMHLTRGGTGSVQLLAVPALWRLFLSLFFGVLGREIMLDCTDVVADKHSGIRTIPVVYGRSFASGAALVNVIIMSALLLIQPLLDFLVATRQPGHLVSSSPLLIRRSVATRRLGFALAASVIMLFRSWQVFHCKGGDDRVVFRAVDESLITVILLLASFV